MGSESCVVFLVRNIQKLGTNDKHYRTKCTHHIIANLLVNSCRSHRRLLLMVLLHWWRWPLGRSLLLLLLALPLRQ